MKTILVVDDMAIFRDPIAISLRAAGFGAVCATNGKEALEILKSQRPDLVLLDLGMPVMDGFGFLKAMRAEPESLHVPVICLTAQADRQRVVDAVALGAKDYILKSRFSMTEMLARIRKRLDMPAASPQAPAPNSTTPPDAPRATPSSASAHQSGGSAPAPSGSPIRSTAPAAGSVAAPAALLTREQCLRRVDSAAHEKTMSGVAAKVIAVAAAPTSELADLASLIACDPTLATRVLRAANSAACGHKGGTIVTIPEAIRKMGFAGVRNLAASVAVLDVMPKTLPDGFSAGRWWLHTLAVAVLSERLAGASAADTSAPYYLVGLCHDLGDLIFHTCFATEYTRIIEAHQATGRTMSELELTMLGVTAPELIAHILGRLGLPEAIRTPIASHQKSIRTRTQPADPVARILSLADSCCNGMLLASSLSSTVCSFTRASCKQSVANESPAIPQTDEFRGEILGLTVALARLSAKEEADLLAPLFPRTSARIWLARDPRLSSFDPIHEALSAMADVTVNNRLPTAAEAKGCAAVLASTATSAKGFTAYEVGQLAAVDGMPILWTTEQIDTPMPAGLPVKPQLWPLTLSGIGHFLQEAEKSQAAPISKAA